MKERLGHVTNSSSSSFIITNNSDETLTSKELVMKLFEKILNDAEDRFELGPGQSITYNCGDHSEDGAFENFIHEQFGSWFSSGMFESEDVNVEFYESNH